MNCEHYDNEFDRKGRALHEERSLFSEIYKLCIISKPGCATTLNTMTVGTIRMLEVDGWDVLPIGDADPRLGSLPVLAVVTFPAGCEASKIRDRLVPPGGEIEY